MRVWVTGATGQIGHRLCAKLKLEGHEIIAFSRRSVKNPTNYQWVRWDLSEEHLDIPDLAAPEVVFHLAAQTSAYEARENLRKDVNTNILGFIELLNAVRQSESFPHVILTGSATEVGITTNSIVCDSDPDDPMTFYDVGKVSQGLYLKQSESEGWLEGTILRLPNVYGGVIQRATSERGFINLSIRQALMGKGLRYYADSENIRDFLHVEDVVTALLSAMNHRENVVSETFVIGTGIGTRIRDALSEIARQVESTTRKSVEIVPEISPPETYDIDRRSAIIDSSRFRERTGWMPQILLKEGIQRTLRESIHQM